MRWPTSRIAVSKHDAAPAATPLSIVSAMSRNPDGQKIKTARKSGCYCPSWIGQRGSYGVGTYSRMRFSVHTVFGIDLSLIHISEPTRQAEISYAVFCLKKKKKRI